MRKLLEVLFYSGEQPFPAYYLIDQLECENLEGELKNKLVLITQRVRKMFGIVDDIPDYKVHEALYVLQDDGLTSLRTIT